MPPCQVWFAHSTPSCSKHPTVRPDDSPGSSTPQRGCPLKIGSFCPSIAHNRRMGSTCGPSHILQFKYVSIDMHVRAALVPTFFAALFYYPETLPNGVKSTIASITKISASLSLIPGSIIWIELLCPCSLGNERLYPTGHRP